MATSQVNQDLIRQPGLLRLPTEVRIEILREVLQTGQHVWTPYYAPAIKGFSLHNLPQKSTSILGCKCDERGLTPIPVSGLISTSRLLRQECHALLAHEYTFIINVDVTNSAPAGSNSFKRIQALDPLFRSQIRSVMVLISFLEPIPPQSSFLEEFIKSMVLENSPLMFEKIVENVNEITSLLTGCEKVHFVWNMFFGNSGLGWMNERYTRALIVRLRKELDQRVIEWTAQNWMGRIDVGPQPEESVV